MTEKVATLDEIISTAVAAAGFEMVGYNILGGESGGKILRIYIDSPSGVNLDACQKVSYQIGVSMDVIEPPLISGKYQLEVSSPGVQRPLFTIEHYTQFIGKQVQIKLNPGVDPSSRRRYVGEIISVVDNNIHLKDEDGSEAILLFSQIESGRLKVDWDELLKESKAKKG